MPRTIGREELLLAAEDDDLAAAGPGDMDERRSFRIDDVERERIVRERCARRRAAVAMARAIESGGSSSSSSCFGASITRTRPRNGSARVERPQGVERAVANLDRRLVHQLAQLHVRGRLIDGRQGRQGVRPEFRPGDDGFAQGVDARCVVEIRQRLGAEVANLSIASS